MGVLLTRTPISRSRNKNGYMHLGTSGLDAHSGNVRCQMQSLVKQKQALHLGRSLGLFAPLRSEHFCVGIVFGWEGEREGVGLAPPRTLRAIPGKVRRASGEPPGLDFTTTSIISVGPASLRG